MFEFRGRVGDPVPNKDEGQFDGPHKRHESADRLRVSGSPFLGAPGLEHGHDPRVFAPLVHRHGVGLSLASLMSLRAGAVSMTPRAVSLPRASKGPTRRKTPQDDSCGFVTSGGAGSRTRVMGRWFAAVRVSLWRDLMRIRTLRVRPNRLACQLMTVRRSRTVAM